MSKSLLLAAAAVAGVSTVTLYYVSPVEAVQTEAPPILVDAEPSQVVRAIRTINLDRYASHFLGEEHRERDLALELFDLAQFSNSEFGTIFDLRLEGELLMQFQVDVKPVPGAMSEIEITTVVGNNAFSSNPALHTYDIRLLESVADFIATDYVSSIVKGHPALSGKRMEAELTKRYAADKDSIREAARRLENTFIATYGDMMRAQAESYAESAYHPSEPFEEEDVMAEIEDAERDAAEAVADAARDVAAAADAAGAAADAARAAAQ